MSHLFYDRRPLAERLADLHWGGRDYRKYDAFAQLGIARTQVQQPVPGASGSLSITGPTAAGVTAVNLSTEGTRDWYCKSGFNSINDRYIDSSTTEHWKLGANGGFIRSLFHWFGPSGTFTLVAGAASPKFTFTSNQGDDATLGGTASTNFINGVAINGPLMTANNGAVKLTPGWGFQLGALGSKNVRQFKIYFRFSPSGVTPANAALNITAHLIDGSAGDQTVNLQPGVTGLQDYVVTIAFRTSQEAIPMLVTFNVAQAAPDSSTQIGFYAATHF